MLEKFLIFVVTCLLAVSAERARYDNYKVIRVTPRTAEEVQLLQLARKSNVHLNFWNEPARVDLPVLIMVPPHARTSFSDFLKINEFDAEVTIPNVQELLDEEDKRIFKKNKAEDTMDWNDYHDLDVILAWLDAQNGLENKNFNVTKTPIGTTYNGETINAYLISQGDNDQRPGVILESGIHAREWIGPAASSWVVNQILQNNDPESIWHQFQYLYIPSLNVDGYRYTWDKNGDRTWRKSRGPYLNGLCYGADINRNWDDGHWGTEGVSHDPCFEDFCGYEVASEVETSSISETMAKLNADQPGIFDVYIAFHSFSQLLMYPWGNTADPTPETPTWNEIANKSVEALTKVHGTEYDFGSIYETIYPASGSSIEYYYAKFKSSLTYVFELRDRGLYGFLLPPDQIIPTAEELIAAIEVILSNHKTQQSEDFD